MRLRNVKNANNTIMASKYIINEPLVYKGKYKDIFNNNNPIHIEIGMGKGKFIIENALRYPNINFIGIEKFDSVLVRAVEKLENTDIPNLRLIKMDALEIDQVFDREIDMIYLNFSDPWPKKRHADRRLTSEVFLNKYNVIFKEIKQIIMKTDNRGLFEYSLKSFTDFGYKIKNISLDLYKSEITNNIATEYEERFSSMGNVIYMVEIDKD